MEAEAARRIWKRSSDGILHYTIMLSDGDSKAYDAVCELKPYDDKVTKKEECINHVEKRLTAALESLKQKGGPSCISLAGKGLLTKKTIAQLHSYYHSAIKSNAGDVEKMKEAILATPYHITSTDDEPDHRYCSSTHWCWYMNAEQ